MKDSEFPYIDFNSDESQVFFERRCTRCPICNRVFIIPVIEDYTYKLTNNKGKSRMLCRWSCYRKAQKICKENRKYNERYSLD